VTKEIWDYLSGKVTKKIKGRLQNDQILRQAQNDKKKNGQDDG